MNEEIKNDGQEKPENGRQADQQGEELKASEDVVGESEAREPGEKVDQEETQQGQEESVEALKEELESTRSKLQEESLRAQAEIQNIHRRAERDVANAHKFGQEKLVKELLAVVDSLERGLESVDDKRENLDETSKALLDGSELTLKMFLDTLEKFSVKAVNPEGEPFDPQFHEAMSMVENPDVEPNTVINVVQKGFTLNGRLVRPAMVIVSKS